MRFLPLGTIIKINNHKMCIIGYTSVEKDAISVGGYLVVSYPIGFTDIDKTFFVPHNAELEVLEEGYKTKASDAVLNTLGKGLSLADKMSVEDISRINQAYKKISLLKKEADKK